MCVAGCEAKVREALSRRSFFKAAAATGFAATAVPARAAESRSFSKVVDLTHTMSPEFPTFLGVAPIEMEKKFDLKKDGFNLYWWRIIEHAGTHMDAPIHFSENGATAEKIAPEQLVADYDASFDRLIEALEAVPVPLQTAVFPRPEYSKKQLGYIRLGGKVPV